MGTYELARLSEVLGDSSRWAIVEQLADRPRAVGELAARMPISRPAVSQHLKVLKDAGLVVEQAAGTRRIYRLNPAAVSALRDQLDAFWARALTGYAHTLVEEENCASSPRRRTAPGSSSSTATSTGTGRSGPP